MDEDELEEELAELQQQELDTKMLNTGHVPVGDQVSKMPSVAKGERKSQPTSNAKSKAKARVPNMG